MNKTVYFVTNDENLSRIMILYMKKEGWNIKLFSNSLKAMACISDTPHLWIFDVNNPNLINYDILTNIKLNNQDTPTIMISNKISTQDRLLGLELGIDDILEKPFSPKELIIRAKRLIGDDAQGVISNKLVLELQRYTINEGSRIVQFDEYSIELTSKEFDLLVLFAKNCGLALSRDQILLNIWGMANYSNYRVVDDLVRRLRKKLETLRIETVYGYGYRACG